MNSLTKIISLSFFIILFSCSKTEEKSFNEKIGFWKIDKYEIIDTNDMNIEGNNLLSFLVSDKIPKHTQIQLEKDSIKLIDQKNNTLLSSEILRHSIDTIFLDGLYGIFNQNGNKAEFAINNINYKLIKQ